MTRHLRLLLPLAALLPLPSHAATIVAGDVTATIGPDFFFDSASTGGGTDFNSANVNFLRDFGTNLDNKLEAYQNIANAINSRLSDGIVHEFNHTFKAYKEFIFNVKDSLS